MKRLFSLFLFLALLGQAQADVTTGLQLRWKLDETSGLFVNDETANNRDGDLISDGGLNNPSFAAGRINNGVNLPSGGNNPRIRITGAGSPGVTNYPATMCLWMRTADTSSMMYLIAIGDLDGSSKLAIYATGGILRGRAENSASSVSWTSDVSYSANTWTHLCFTANTGTNKLILYKDGSSAGTTTTAQTLSGFDAFMVGANQGGSQGFVGDVDEVWVFSRELTASDVLEVYNYGLAAKSRARSQVY